MLASILPAQLLLARAHAALGQPEKADRVMAQAARHMGPHMAIYGPQVTLANAWVAAARGGDKTAIALAHKAGEAAHEAGQYAVEAEALHDAARFGDRDFAQREAAQVSDDRRRELADYFYENNGSKADLVDWITHLYQEFQNRLD